MFFFFSFFSFLLCFMRINKRVHYELYTATGCQLSSDQLFERILNNPHHTLYQLLPPQSAASQKYNLRRRTHDRQLRQHQGHLSDCNFITRLLYKIHANSIIYIVYCKLYFLLCRLTFMYTSTVISSAVCQMS